MKPTDLHPVLDYLRSRAIAETTVASHTTDPALRSVHLDRAAELDALAELVEKAIGEGVTP
jgi:hypothetical protein